MNWTTRGCLPSDMIRTKLETAYHYGIYISDTEIIQFGPPPSQLNKIDDDKIKVIVSDLNFFCQGKTVEAADFDNTESHKKNSSKKIIKKARQSVGDGGYNLLRNNCEHFAYRCVFGNRLLIPSDLLREQWKNRPRLDIYFSKIPDTVEFEKVFPKKRNSQIIKTSNPDVKKEKFWAWKTLEYASLRSFGISIEKLNPKMTRNGKWTGDKIFFSISHSKGIIAVAISNKRVGIDIENKEDFLKNFAGKEQKLSEIIDSKNDSTIEELLEQWTQKEACYKNQKHQKSFMPSKVRLDKENLFTGFQEIDEKIFCYSVHSELKDILKIYFFEEANIA